MAPPMKVLGAFLSLCSGKDVPLVLFRRGLLNKGTLFTEHPFMSLSVRF